MVVVLLSTCGIDEKYDRLKCTTQQRKKYSKGGGERKLETVCVPVEEATLEIRNNNYTKI